MILRFLFTSILSLLPAAAFATMSATPWRPLFKGIDHAVGTNVGTTLYTNNGIAYTISRLQSVNCLRIDLTDPDVQLFSTPRATNFVAGSVETKTLSISNFVKQYGVKVATVANFYNSSQGTDPPLEGLNCQVFGLSISTGQVVSVPDTGPDSNGRYTSMLFTTNKTPFFIISNTPPGTNTTGIYTAVTGYYPVLTNGTVLGDVLRTIYPDPTVHDSQPRTVFGLSEDRRYFYMMVIDGRQTGYSEGANDAEMGIWLLQFGASDGVSMDGGGSAAMYYADCVGSPKPLGHSSYVPLRGRERITGSQLGVFALELPSFIENVSASTGTTNATISWTTESNATSQVEYGLTPAFGSFTPLDSAEVTNHSIDLTGLKPSTLYYFRVHSRAGAADYSSSCGVNAFVTTNFGSGLAFAMNSAWKFNTNNLDGVAWQMPAFDDSGWSNGPAALWADTRLQVPANSTNFIPNFATGTRLRPIGGESQYPFPTYYFRKTFVFSNDPAGVSLIFSNYIDDGAIFYLNGVEIHRTNVMAAPTVVRYSSNAIAFSFDNATSPILFNVGSDFVTNLVAGTNTVAVEVHNYRNPSGSGNPSPDVTFESALIYLLPPPVPVPAFITNVMVAAEEARAVLTWNTRSNSTTQVSYGLSPALGAATPLETNLSLNHTVILAGLEPRRQYYFQLLSTIGTTEYSYEGTFTTASFYVPLITFSNIWRFTTNNLDGENWMAGDYDDSNWTGEGPALLYLEDNPAVEPRITPLPAAAGVPYPTYYFRTHFALTNSPAGLAMVFTNHVDDGAIFYLNGAEIQRLRMPTDPTLIFYTTSAAACPPNACETTVDVPDVFRIAGDAITNLIVGGDNVLAAEVHQHTGVSSDIVFGSALGLVRELARESRLRVARADDTVCISWDGEFLTLQEATPLQGTNWMDVPGPVRSSPYCVTNAGASRFYRLRD